MRRVKKACVSSSAIPSWWSTQPSRVTLMLKVKSPMRRVYIQSLADVLAPALVGRDDPPPDLSCVGGAERLHPSWASSPNSKRDSTADHEGRPLGDSVIVATAIS